MSAYNRNRLFEEAARFAVEAHAGMVRKTGSTPYVLHPMEVACIAATMTDDSEVLAAALLHDVVEDTPVTLDEIDRRFGRRVAELVDAETEDKHVGTSRVKTWRTRKEGALSRLERADRDVKIVWLADKLSNMRSFARLYIDKGDSLWLAFHQSDPAQQAWYYRSVASLCSELGETPAYREYVLLMDAVFGGVQS